ncbi:hypothetical protein BH11PLA2_BH11PLA2_30310 [soil metagenome]
MRLSLLAVSCLIVASGAGCDSGTKLVTVSGIVLIDGQPLTHGVVQVAPNGHRAAFAPIGKDGRFTLSTGPNSTGDGVIPGTHRVAVIAHETLGPGSQKWHAPKKYLSVETSGLTITVDKSTNDLVINLTWDGGKPFIETGSKE